MFGNFSSFMTPFQGQVSTPNSFVSLFIFYILSYLLLKTMGCLSVCLVSSASVQKLFCGIARHSNHLSMIFWGRKWSPHPIPPPPSALPRSPVFCCDVEVSWLLLASRLLYAFGASHRAPSLGEHEHHV